jgi:hypothetical protein
METTHREIVDYWSRHQDECGLSVDWAEAEGLCWRCAHARLLQRCHIIPRSLGGTEDASNLVLLCRQCNAEAPNVADAEFVWVWLRAHAVAFYGTYWHERGLREYEFIYGVKPLAGFNQAESALQRLLAAMERHIKRTTTHWGQGKLNPATVAWLLRQVEREASNDASHLDDAKPASMNNAIVDQAGRDDTGDA